MTNSNSLPKVPVLPHWCDVNSWDYKNQILFYGLCYILLGLSKVMESIYIFVRFDHDLTKALNLIFWAIFVLGIVEICITIYFIKKAQVYHFKVIRQWFFCNIGIITVYFILVIAILCVVPFNYKNVCFVSFKIVTISVLNYRTYSKYYKPNQQMLSTY